MSGFRISPRLLVTLVLVIIAGIGFSIRVAFPYAQVFGGDWVKFTSIDAYYHMRLVDNIVHNFPQVIKWDYYLLYPGVTSIGKIHFFDLLLAGIIWVAGLGSPSEHLLNVIGVYYPVALALLTIIPVYFIGKVLFGRWVGVIAAGLLMVMPGEYMGRTILGFTDYHVAETLFATTTIMFLLYAVKAARERGFAFEHLLRRDWSIIRRPLVLSLLAGFSLWIYLITWAGALLFVFIIAAYLVVQFIIDHLRGKSTDYLTLVGFTLFLVPLVLFWRSVPRDFYRLAMVAALLLPLIAGTLAFFMRRQNIRRAYYPLVLLGVGVVAAGIFFAAAPSMLKTMLIQFDILVPRGGQTTMEMGPLLSPRGAFTFGVAWGNFTLGFFITIGYLLYLLIYRNIYRRQWGAEENLLLVWSVIILLATLAQRRFAYYFAVNVAVMTAYVSWLAIWYAGLRRLAAQHEDAKKEEATERARARKKLRTGINIYHVNTVLTVIVVFFFVFAPNVWFRGASIDVAKQARFAPTDAWQEALYWMRDNTPEPFGDAAYYDEHYESSKYKFPETAYGVMTWWDYGYWITRIAHRVPNANPSQPPGSITDTANFFLAQDETSGQGIIDKLGSSYIIIDDQTIGSKIWAVIDWSGQQQSKFFDTYHIPQGNTLTPVVLFYPEYYQSLVVRLYNFNAEAVTSVSPVAITYQETVHSSGQTIKELTDAKQFESYEEALAYVREQNSDKVRIVGGNHFVSPLPLEPLRDYQLVYSSQSGVMQPEVGFVPGVKIFEYTAAKAAK
ncbi:oligosaccharyl transferase, archaeosortase A system-associated [Chloroflexota bacterium]